MFVFSFPFIVVVESGQDVDMLTYSSFSVSIQHNIYKPCTFNQIKKRNEVQRLNFALFTKITVLLNLLILLNKKNKSEVVIF